MRQQVAILFLITSLIASAQTPVLTLVDTSTAGPKTIPVSEISIKSSEALIWTRKMSETLLSERQIEQIDLENDSLIHQTDSLLVADRQSGIDSRNIRRLNNKIVYWQQITTVVNAEKSFLSDELNKIISKEKDLDQRRAVWVNTRTALKGKKSESGLIDNIDELAVNMDSIADLIDTKREKLLLILDRTTKLDFAMIEYIEEIELTIAKREGELFVRQSKSLFTIDLSDRNSWSIREPLKTFYRLEVKQLFEYLKLHFSKIIFQLLLILALYFGFRSIRNRLNDIEISEDSFFLKTLSIILSHTSSASLILGLFASILIFPIRPALFIDITILIVIIPLITITKTLLQKSYLRYLYLFGFIVYFQMLINIYPPNNLIYRASLIFIAIVEMLLLYHYFQKNKKDPISRTQINVLINILLILNLCFAFIGIVGGVSGATTLADYGVVIPIDAAFSAMLIIISAIIINGIIEFWTDYSSGKNFRSIRLYGVTVKKKAIGIVNLGAAVFWFHVFLKNINIEKPVIDAIREVFTAELKLGSATLSLGKIATFFLVIWLSMVISKIVRTILEKDVLNRLKLAKGLPHTIAMIVRYSLVTVGVILAVSAAGIPLTNLTVLLGAFGVGIGFGLQSIFNNLVSGLILLFERPIQIGDTIEVGELMGNVKSIGIRSSNVRTFDGAEVIVPNGQLVSNEVVNWTLSDQQKRLEIIVGVAYGSNPHKVQKLFMKILEEHPDIIQKPTPMVLFIDLGDSSLDFRLLFWTTNIGEWLRIRSEVVYEVHDMLYSEGIQIPFPQRDLHIRSIDPKIDISGKANSVDS